MNEKGTPMREGEDVSPDSVVALSEEIGARLKAAGLTLAAAESCTGGLIGHLITENPGSSDYFAGSAVVYSYTAKEAVVSVADGGPGLPDEVRERLFSPHVTTKVGGSGMGLFLARQLVVGMHGGMLEVTDGEEGGTVATVRLPLDDGGVQPGEPDLE